MPRLAGQIDLTKTEAILDAAATVLAERGLAAPLEDIARQAGVSKQTIYNHYGSKTDLIRALLERRVAQVTAVLETPGVPQQPEAALAALARMMLKGMLSPNGSAMLRLTIQSGADIPDLAQAVYESGPKASRTRLAAFLRQETVAGRMDVDDFQQAADFFIGMLSGPYQTALLLGIDRGLDEAGVDRLAHAAARRFMRAYAP